MQFIESKDYNEINLLSYIPKSAVINGTSLLLYDREQIKLHLEEIEKKMIQNPLDPRTEYKILAYYTAFPPKREDVLLLRKKRFISWMKGIS